MILCTLRMGIIGTLGLEDLFTRYHLELQKSA